MTENYSERIENALNDIKNIQTLFRTRYGKECLADKEIEEVLKISKEEHEEIRQYRAIGTVEECREARERQRAKKPVMKPFYKDMEEEYLCCPNCGDILTDRIPMDNKDFYFHCLNCGQKFDWTDTL